MGASRSCRGKIGLTGLLFSTLLFVYDAKDTLKQEQVVLLDHSVKCQKVLQEHYTAWYIAQTLRAIFNICTISP